MKRILIFSLLSVFFSHNVIAQNFQEQNSEFYNNLLNTLQEELRDHNYRKEVLPNDFSYLSDLIVLGNKNNKPPTYLRSVIKLFSNILKGAEYVNAYAFSQLIADFPKTLQPYFELHKSRTYITNQTLYDAHMFDRFKETVNNMLYTRFSSEYENFKQNPQGFLETISSEILSMAQEEVTRTQLRQDIIRFCEIALSKMIWSPEEKEKTWHITKKISNQLASLLEHNILDDVNDLDDLYWTLLHRYCYFIDITATDLPISFYEAVKKDITTQQLILFELEEQDYIVAPKIECFTRTLMQAQAKAHAYNRHMMKS